jgi:cell wall-associated NlpC family hydrolase
VPLKRPVGVVALVVVVALGAAVGVTAPALAAPTFPTWGDVQKAKRNVTTKKAEIVKLTALVASLGKQADAAGKIALQRGEDYLEAQNALTAAEDTATRLQAQATAAKKQATASARVAGQLAAQLARTGSGNITLALLLNGHDAGNLLERLGTMSKLTEASSKIYAFAQQDQKAAAALTDQATVAKQVRVTKSAAAKKALASAKAASDVAQAKVAEENKRGTVLTAQLASLKGTSAKKQAAYFAGVAWEKKQAEQAAPPADIPPPSSGGGGGGGGSANPPSVPNGTAVGVAIRYAEAQLGESYVLGGMGPNVWDCSGLTKAAYAAAGVYIGTHSSNDQYNTMRAEGRLVPLSQRKAGDLLWYSDGGNAGGDKYHVTLYIGNGQMIEAPYPGAVVRIRPVRFGDLVPYAGRPTG